MLIERALKTQTGHAVIVVGRDGVARLRAEADRVAKIKAAGVAPAQCGPEVPNAPARGAVRISDPKELVPGTTDKFQHAGHFGRSVMHRCDVFDTMHAQALKAHAKVKAANADAVFDEPFNAGQVSTARHYAALHESLEEGTYQASTYGWGKATAEVKKIGHITHVSEESLADADQLQTEIDSELRYGLDLEEDNQILAGDGTGYNLEGLLTAAPSFVAASGLPNATRIDRLRLAILQVTLEDYIATSMLMTAGPPREILPHKRMPEPVARFRVTLALIPVKVLKMAVMQLTAAVDV